MRSDLAGEVGLVRAAFQVLTRIPVPGVAWDDTTLVRAARYFPLVGCVVGAISAAILVVARLAWSDAVSAVLAIGATLLVTGALHEDGLADTADSLGGHDPARRLAIMKDSRIGTFGTCALVIGLASKIAALAALPLAAAVPALIAAASGGRLACVLAMAALPYIGERAAAKLEHGRAAPTWPSCLVAALFGLAPFLLLDAARAVPALCLGGALAALVAWRMNRLVGGHTGDVLGAIEMVFETGALLGAARVLPA